MHVVSWRAPGSTTTGDSARPRVYGQADVAFPWGSQGRHLQLDSRSSIPGPPVPLSTLRLPPRDGRRKTRGQDGSLLLSCRALSSPTTCRFIPALGPFLPSRAPAMSLILRQQNRAKGWSRNAFARRGGPNSGDVAQCRAMIRCDREPLFSGHFGKRGERGWSLVLDLDIWRSRGLRTGFVTTSRLT